MSVAGRAFFGWRGPFSFIRQAIRLGQRFVPWLEAALLKVIGVMNKDPAELARICREQAAITSTAETRTALHEMADKYDRMAASQKNSAGPYSLG